MDKTEYLSKIIEYDEREIHDFPNAHHSARVSDDFFIGRDDSHPIKKYAIRMKRPRNVVILSNDEDSYYCQYFYNWDEIKTFIEEITKVATEAWGEQPTNNRGDNE